jgi:protein TonB
MASLAIVLVSFQWKQYDMSLATLGQDNDDMLEEEFIPPSEQVKPPPPPPPPPQVVTVIEIIEDDSEEEETIEAVDMEVDEDTEIDIVEIVEEEEPEEDQIFMSADVQPEFPGGQAAFGKFLMKNIAYPDLAMETNTQGKVYVKFVVQKDGSINKVQVLKGIGAGCDEEAVRVIKSVPKWKPGEQMGKAVNVWYTVPVNFRLQ